MVFSILALLAVCISICIKDRKKSLYVQSLNCFFEAIYDFLISAFTGINKNKFSKSVYLIILFIFEGIIMINCYFSWTGWVSLLPTIGSMIRSYCLWQSNMKLVRISGITTGILYGSYYIYYHSWFMVLGDFILLLTGIYTLYKNDIRRKSNNEVICN